MKFMPLNNLYSGMKRLAVNKQINTILTHKFNEIGIGKGYGDNTLRVIKTWDMFHIGRGGHDSP